MVCFYTPVSVVNMTYIKDNSITFFLRPTLLEREPYVLMHRGDCVVNHSMWTEKNMEKGFGSTKTEE